MVIPGVVRDGRSLIFEADWRPDELLERAGIKVPDADDYETVAGLVLADASVAWPGGRASTWA